MLDLRSYKYNWAFGFKESYSTIESSVVAMTSTVKDYELVVLT